MTLSSGQAFRWRRADDGWWHGCLEPGGECVRLRRLEAAIEIASSVPNVSPKVYDLFRLDKPQGTWIADWNRTGGPEICDAISKYPGLRVMRQDPWEALVSFLASPAAPIYRIMRAMEGLAERLGEPCGQLHRFPTPEALASANRSQTDACGLGFRGPNLIASAAIVVGNGGRKWLDDLRLASYQDATRALVALPGVGEKIADCICLFALDKDEAVPIDVHMARVASVLFPDAPKSLTPKAYAVISGLFRERFGAHAGWAQQYLYVNQIAHPATSKEIS